MPSRLHAAVLSLVAVAGTGVIIAGQADRASAAPPGRLTVVELFQSQGCSSCPPAADNLNALAGRPDILALSYGVTYWDRLGWKDTFATPQFTDRQWAYARSRNRSRVWTPQVFVDGQADIVGSNRAQLTKVIAASKTIGPSATVRDGKVTVGVGRAPAQGAVVWLVRYDPRTVQVPIRAGENGGRTLPHRNTVRELTQLGRWTGAAATYAIPAANIPGLATAALVQAGPGGAILAAAKG